MDVQGRQEALAVELQRHQKLGVRSRPMGSLIRPPLSISVVPAKPPVSLVTAHVNGQKAVSCEPLQTSPINLQTGGRAAPCPQVLGTLTALPIKVPQVSSLRRLVGPAATVLPQVRPTTQIPHRVTAMVSPRSQNTPINSTFGPDCHNDPSPPTEPSAGMDSGSPVQQAPAGPGVAYAIIAASPASGNGVSSVGEAVKVIIIQPQVPSSSGESPGVQEAPPKTKFSHQEDPEKVAFMVALGLVTTEHLEEIQMKRQERKRRSTANPAYSGPLEPERKRLPSHYLDSSLYLSAADSEDFCWKDLDHAERCFVCKEDGELQLCYNCPRAIHPSCLHPPLSSPPRSPWYCPRCQKKVLNKENLSWSRNPAQPYVTHKTVRQEEKRRLMRRNIELKEECAHLEEEDQKLNETLKLCVDQRDRLLGQQRDTQVSLDRLRALLRLIQVTMTTPLTQEALSD